MYSLFYICIISIIWIPVTKKPGNCVQDLSLAVIHRIPGAQHFLWIVARALALDLAAGPRAG